MLVIISAMHKQQTDWQQGNNFKTFVKASAFGFSERVHVEETNLQLHP